MQLTSCGVDPPRDVLLYTCMNELKPCIASVLACFHKFKSCVLCQPFNGCVVLDTKNKPDDAKRKDYTQTPVSKPQNEWFQWYQVSHCHVSVTPMPWKHEATNWAVKTIDTKCVNCSDHVWFSIEMQTASHAQIIPHSTQMCRASDDLWRPATRNIRVEIGVSWLGVDRNQQRALSKHDHEGRVISASPNI